MRLFDISAVFDRSDPLKRNFVIRMRCAFTPSVRSIARCSNFKVGHTQKTVTKGQCCDCVLFVHLQPIYCSASLKFGKTEQTRGKFQGVLLSLSLSE